MSQPVPSDLASLVERELPAVLADLRGLVECETFSLDRPALESGLAGIDSWLSERLGEPMARTRHSGGEHGDILDLTYAGNAGGTVLFPCHYDTVWPAGTLAEWPFSVDDDRITGPGCLDMKFGIVQVVWALRILRELGIAHPSVRLLLTGDEEIGSPASRPHIERTAEQVDATLVLEPSKDGMAKTHRKGMGLFEIVVHGIESHAGLNPEAGASAIHALAELVPSITALAAPEHGTTVNVGTISGGTGSNVVAGRASCEIDVRVQDPAEMPRISAGLAALSPSDHRVKVQLGGDWNRPPMNPNPASEELLGRAREAARNLGTELETTSVGGASDANFLSALGHPVLDGLGAVGAGPHSRDEHVVVSSIPHRIALVAGILVHCTAT